MNLLSNALEATPAGGTVTSTTYPAELVSDGEEHADSVPGARGVVVIDVSDTGSGIKPEHIASAIKRHFTTKPSGKGTGLGLPVCRRIIEAEHYGKMQKFSEIDRRTNIRITHQVAVERLTPNRTPEG